MRCVAVVAAVLGVALCQTSAGADFVAALLVGGVALAVLLAALGLLFGALHTLMGLLRPGSRERHSKFGVTVDASQNVVHH